MIRNNALTQSIELFHSPPLAESILVCYIEYTKRETASGLPNNKMLNLH